MYFDFGREQPCTRQPLSLRCAAAACDARSYAHKAVRLARQFDLPTLLRAVEDRWGFVHVSPAAARVARPHLPVGARHFIVTHPVEATPGPPVAVAANRPFLYVGRFLREKGCLDLAEVGGAAGLELWFMGQGPLRDALQARCPGARFLPWGSAADVVDALSRSRALVLPSICHETFGMVVPEALARGVPVIVSDRVGASALVEDGVNGMIHKAGDHEDLRQCLTLMRSDERVRMMGVTAYRRYWAAPPTSAAHARALSTVFAEMLRPLGDPPRRQ
jgi:glycosyltransferase involved in cell wall biosynthesis